MTLKDRIFDLIKANQTVLNSQFGTYDKDDVKYMLLISFNKDTKKLTIGLSCRNILLDEKTTVANISVNKKKKQLETFIIQTEDCFRDILCNCYGTDVIGDIYKELQDRKTVQTSDIKKTSDNMYFKNTLYKILEEFASFYSTKQNLIGLGEELVKADVVFEWEWQLILKEIDDVL